MSLEHDAALAYPYRHDTGVDHKAWAKRIAWREQQGDKTLLPIQIKFAREALDIKEDRG